MIAQTAAKNYEEIEKRQNAKDQAVIVSQNSKAKHQKLKMKQATGKLRRTKTIWPMGQTRARAQSRAPLQSTTPLRPARTFPE